MTKKMLCCILFYNKCLSHMIIVISIKCRDVDKTVYLTLFGGGILITCWLCSDYGIVCYFAVHFAVNEFPRIDARMDMEMCIRWFRNLLIHLSLYNKLPQLVTLYFPTPLF